MVSETKPATPDSETSIDALIDQLTLAEKVSLLAGSSMWFTHAGRAARHPGDQGLRWAERRAGRQLSPAAK